MSIPSTPEDEKSPPGSPQNSDSSFNESTVFCFYKKWKDIDSICDIKIFYFVTF